MTTLDELRARVEADYDQLELPTWPNPHASVVEPRDEEYSRVTNPGRYRIVHERARVWARTLQDDLGVTAEDVPPLTVTMETWSVDFVRGVRLRSPRPGTLPLLLLERQAWREQGTPLAVLGVSVARPDIMVAMQPDCGCDACDYGSASLLDAVDDAIGQIIEGPFVALRAKGWHATWCPGGGAAGGGGRMPDYRELMGICRRLADGERVRLPRGAEAHVGRSWLG